MKITKVIGYCLSSPYGDGKVFGQPMGVKSIGLVEVHTDSGIIGLGETYSGVYVPELIGPTAEFLESLIIGKNPLEIEKIYDSMEIPFVAMNGFIRSVISAVEISLWDIKGQVEERPIAKLIGNRYTYDFNIYASGGSVTFSENDIKKDIEEILSEGFDSYKMRVGVQEWEKDIARIETARKELGSNNLMVDAIQGTLNTWNFVHLLSYAKDLERYNLTWLEEPLHPSKLREWQSLRPLVKLPIATGEGLSGKLDFDSYLSQDCIDIIQPDVTHCGGFIRAELITELAQKTNKKVAMHVWGSSISLMANLHMAISMDIDWLEVPMVSLDIFSDEFKDIKEMIVNKDFDFKNGLGIKITDDIKNKYKFIKGSGYKI